MTSHPIRILASLFLGVFAMSPSAPVQADDLLVFVSAFSSGDQAAIQAYKFDCAAGQLKPAKRTSEIQNPFFLALSQDRKFLYSIHVPGQFGGKENERVAAFQIVGNDGELKALNDESSLGTASCYLAVDRTGKTLVVANYSSGSIASLPINADGSLQKAATFIQHTGSSVIQQRQSEPHAHCSVISPDNKYVYAADLGIDKIMIYKLDAQSGKMTPNGQPFVRTPPKSGPRHLTFHPNGKMLYVINELANTVTHFDYLADSGMLIERDTISTVPSDFTGTSHTADVKITPNGKFLYGTNRGHDSVASYKIADDGSLSLIGIEPSLGKGPQNLAITPDGQWLICANMPGNNLIVFKIDQQTGVISPYGSPTTLTGPSCIMIR